MLILTARMWYLSVLKHEEYVEKARGPQQREVLVRAERGTIRDRFNRPLAINRTQYNAAILYAQIRQVPRIEWVTDDKGHRVKRYCRAEHIKKLAALLGKELSIDSQEIEDQIHSKAALFPQMPVVIKADLSEEEYYRLRMLERNWPGLLAERTSKRDYPLGSVAAHVIGYMGAIGTAEYERYAQELRELRYLYGSWKQGEETPSLPEGLEDWHAVKHRLEELEEQAYTIDDRVGKTGAEAAFEKELRGRHGSKTFYTDAKGNFIKELPGARSPVNGQRILLSVSAELQEYVEQLLVQSERLRDGKSRKWDRSAGTYTTLKQPWIKGAAAVVMDPYSGDILALASYPRFDPNDFVTHGESSQQREKTQRIHGWFEDEEAIAAIWEGKRPLRRETFIPPYTLATEEIFLTWEHYLDCILPSSHPVREGLARVHSIEAAVSLLQTIEKDRISSGAKSFPDLLNAYYSGAPHQQWRNALTPTERQTLLAELSPKTKFWDRLLRPMAKNYDKLLLLDICRLLVDEERFSPALRQAVGGRALAEYHADSSAFAVIDQVLKEMIQEVFHEEDFRKWRMSEGRQYLKIMRKQEQAAKHYARPYMRYYTSMERELFAVFWERHRWNCLSAFLRGDTRGLEAWGSSTAPYVELLLSWYRELSMGAHMALPWVSAYHRLQGAVASFSPPLAKEYLQTMRSYKELTRPLFGTYRSLRSGVHKAQEKHLAAAFYPLYGFGFARSHGFRQAAPQGSLFKLVTAYATLMQVYEEKQARGLSTRSLNPLTIIDRPYRVAGTQRWVMGQHDDGQVIPQLYKGGRLVRSVSSQVGRVDLTAAMERSSNPYFSLLAADVLNDPEQLNQAASALSYGAKTGIELPGEFAGRLPDDLSYNPSGLYSYAIGQHTLVTNPLQAAVMLSALANGGTVLEPKILSLSVEQSRVQEYPPRVRRRISLPKDVRDTLMQGMAAVTRRLQTTGYYALSRHYGEWTEPLRALTSLGGDIIGKTSTAESLEFIDLDAEQGVQMYNHTWFGGIALKDGRPDLVVVVYLRFGSYGNLAAPLAADIILKWREIEMSAK